MAITIFTAAITALITAVITGIATFAVQERRLRTELRTEFMAEQAARALLDAEKWTKRSFEEIAKRLGGFDDNELRKILVRAGAVRFETAEGKEFWGLVSRNKNDV